MNWESELLAAFALINTVEVEPIEYRIHYDSTGRITQCSMRNHPKDTEYIVVTREEYENYYKYTVENGALKKILHQHNYSVKLNKSNSGYRVVKNHAGILLTPTDEYNDIEYYDHRID